LHGYEAIIESIKRGKGIESEVREVACNKATSCQVGQSKARWTDIVTGTCLYSRLGTARLLHLVLRSPHPHARIRRIDTTITAKALKGVHAVFSYEDVPRRPIPLQDTQNLFLIPMTITY